MCIFLRTETRKESTENSSASFNIKGSKTSNCGNPVKLKLKEQNKDFCLNPKLIMILQSMQLDHCQAVQPSFFPQTAFH